MDRLFGGYNFERIDAIEPDRDSTGAIREFMPQSRYRNARALPLNEHGAGPFCRFTVARGVHSPGVYMLTLNGQTVYVGKCHDLGERFGSRGYGAIQPKNCFVGGQSTNCKINNRVLQHAKRGQTIELWFHTTDEGTSIERDLIVKTRPPWNGQVPW
jgi:hypothetical protein